MHQTGCILLLVKALIKTIYTAVYMATYTTLFIITLIGERDNG